MVEVGEVVMAIRAEGAETAQEELESVDDAVEDTTDSMADQGQEMQDLANRFSGAMSVALTGLLLTSATLASQVPVLGELFDSLFGILQAVALQVDQFLRPALTPLINTLFGLQATIAGLEGPMATLVGLFGTLVGVVAPVVGSIAALLAKLGKLGAAKAVVVGAAKALVAGLVAIAGVISLPVAAVAGLIAILGLLAYMFREEIVDAITTGLSALRDFAVNGAGAISSFVTDSLSRLGDWLVDGVGLAVDFATDFASALSDFASDVGSHVTDMAHRVADIITDLVSDAYRWGRDLVQALIDGITAKADDLNDAVEDTMSGVRDRLPNSPAQTGPLSDIDRSGPALIDEMTSGIESRSGALRETLEAAVEAGGNGDGGSLPGGQREINVRNFMDGREIGRGTSAERFDENARRGNTF